MERADINPALLGIGTPTSVLREQRLAEEASRPTTTRHRGDERSGAVKSFLSEVEQLSRKHNLSLAHEDQHGAFEVYTYDDNYARWLADAAEVVVHPAEA
jgi:hypothetical protein